MTKTLKITTKALDKLHDRYAKILKFNGLVSDKTSAAWQAYTDARDALAEPIEAALKAANGRASAHAITLMSEVSNVALDVEKTLADRGVTQKNRVGTVATYTPSGPSAKSYKYAAKSTTIVLRRVADGWRLTDAREASVWPKQAERLNIKISKAASEDITRHAFANIDIAE